MPLLCRCMQLFEKHGVREERHVISDMVSPVLNSTIHKLNEDAKFFGLLTA